MMHSTNYTNTLILPSADCKAPAAKLPAKPDSVAGRQYALIADAPYGRTSDDILSTVQADRKDVPQDERTTFRQSYFSKGQPCLRCSPLVKTHGWAIHFDSQAQVALVDPQTTRFAELMDAPDIKKVQGMRNAR